MQRFEGKVAVVTAATRGIGYAIVTRLAEEGATVYLGTPSMEEAVEPVAALRDKGYNVHAVYNNAFEKETFTTMIDTVAEKEGHIDILVNNFGSSDPRVDKDINETSYDTFMSTLDVNLASVYLPVQAVVPYMKAQGGGSIINISSVGGLRPSNSQIAYGTSKCAINYLTKSIAIHCADFGIRCNAVLPGMTATAAVANSLTDGFRESFTKHVPLSRMATPEEIAGAVAYFASDDAIFTTAQLMEVSGGYGVPAPVFGDSRGKTNKR